MGMHPTESPTASLEPYPLSKLPQFILFERPGATGKVNVDKLRASLALAAQELHTPENAFPGAVVFHITEAEAGLFGVKDTSVWRTGRDGGIRYEFWVVGEPTDEKHGVLAVILLQYHFHISLSLAETKRAVLAVKGKLRETVSAEELARSRAGGVVTVQPAEGGYLASSPDCFEMKMTQPCVP